MHKNLPDRDYFLGKEVPGHPDYKIIEFIGSGYNALVFKAHSDIVNNDFACKIIPTANLIGKDLNMPTWKQEINKANILDSRSVVKAYHVNNWKDANNDIDCMVICFEYVNGKNLEQYIEKNSNNIAVTLCEKFLEVMLWLIDEMENHNSQHGDLHLRNIMIEDKKDILGRPNPILKITDFGVATATSGARLKNDYEQTARILRQLLDNVNYQSASARDRFAYNILNKDFLARYLIEDDTTREPLARNARGLYEKVDSIDNEFRKFNAQEKDMSKAELTSPFDFLSCEQLGESHNLLRTLYSDLFLGLSLIEGRNNLVLTGPRGCGKSTVFKSLSLSHRIEENPQDIKYLGIYYRCDDLYFAFPRYQLPDRTEAYDIPMHYLTATLICALFNSIELWARKYFNEKFVKNQTKVCEEIWSILDLTPPTEPGVNNFKAIDFRLQKERKRAVRKQPLVHDLKQKIGDYFGPEILIRVCEVLKKRFSFLREKPFYFFVDDYSMPKITEDLQKNLNRLLMQRTSIGFFKLSTESPVSFIPGDIDGKSYVEEREFVWLNLALKYLTATREEKINFIEDVFLRRFQAIKNYPVSNLDELIGSYKISGNDVAEKLKAKGKPDMWGKDVLMELCSGDIFYIISLVHRMVLESGGMEGLKKNQESPKINKGNQKKAIRAEAGSFLSSVRRLKTNGEHLVAVVTAFGNVAYSYLKFQRSRNEERNPPYQASRIEPYEELCINEEAQKVYSDLLRYSLFIEDYRGKSRRGKVVPRLYLRRLLLPHFNLTFNTRDSIGMETAEMESLLLRPKDFEKARRLIKESEEKKENRQMQIDEFLSKK